MGRESVPQSCHTIQPDSHEPAAAEAEEHNLDALRDAFPLRWDGRGMALPILAAPVGSPDIERQANCSFGCPWSLQRVVAGACAKDRWYYWFMVDTDRTFRDPSRLLVLGSLYVRSDP